MAEELKKYTRANGVKGTITQNAGWNKTIEENIEKLLENQELLLQKTAKLVVMMDEFKNVLSEKIKVPTKKEEMDPSVELFEPIDNEDDFQKLENQLKDESIFNTFVEEMSFICSENAKENTKTLDSCYLLVDWFFTRKFMTLCSWTGVSRHSNVEKIPLKIYKNTMNLFFQLIYESDNTFTMLDCEKFFKIVLKNSTRRNDNSRPSRQSKTKNMKSRIGTKTKKDVEKVRIEEKGEEEEIKYENSSHDDSDE